MEGIKIWRDGLLGKRSVTLYMLTLVLLNAVYITFEIYKTKISKPLLGKTNITQLEFSKIETLSNYSYFVEISFLIVALIWTSLMCIKKYRPFFNKNITIQFAFLVSLFILNYGLSWFFGATVGNFELLVIGYLVIVFVSSILFNLFSRIRNNNAETAN